MRRSDELDQVRVGFELRVHRVEIRRLGDRLRHQQAIERVTVVHGELRDARFADVPFDNPLCPWIEELAARDITGGCGAEPPTYCPAAPVTRAQMAVFVTRSFGLDLYGP